MTVEGLVDATNATGVRIGDQWLNISRYRPVDLPEVGTHIRAEVDAKGYLKQIEVLKTSAPIRSSRDATITRLAVLKAAARFAADRPDIKSADVLQIADRWLAWIET